METKHILASIVLLAAGSTILLATLLWQRMRDFALFFLTFGSALISRMDVNFLGEYWYRGSSRGIEVSLIDLAAVSLLVATVLLPRYRDCRWLWPAGFLPMALYL